MRSDERVQEHREDIEAKRWNIAGVDQLDGGLARGGVEIEIEMDRGEGDGGDEVGYQGMHVCEKCTAGEISAMVSNQAGDLMDQDLGSQHGWDEKLCKVKSRSLRMVLISSAKEISQFNKEMSSAVGRQVD